MQYKESNCSGIPSVTDRIHQMRNELCRVIEIRTRNYREIRIWIETNRNEEGHKAPSFNLLRVFAAKATKTMSCRYKQIDGNAIVPRSPLQQLN